jgi:tetratricopeptide (TPR) repeat protein
LFASGALAGCAGQLALDDGGASLPDARIELASVPFFAQTELQCGPAALATVLGAAGRDAAPDDLAGEVYTPGLGGSLQIELVAAARARGLLPYELEPEPAALMAELAAGRPPLVLQNLRLEAWPAWHYAVLVGVEPEERQVLLRSGTERRKLVGWSSFLRTWRRAGSWALVLLEPGELPARPERRRYFEAVAGLEETGRYEAAARAWQVALTEWHDDPVARYGLATAHHLAGDLDAARAGYEALLLDQPGHAAALNNLADLAAASGCPAAARRLAERARSSTDNDAIAAAIADTLAGLPPADVDGAGCGDWSTASAAD